MKTVRDGLTEMGVTPEAEISRLRAEAKKLLDDYNAEVDEYNAGFDAALAGKTLNDEPNDIRFDVWQAGFRAASYDALRAAVERLAGELEQARAALAAAEEKLTRAAYARTRTDLPVEPADLTAEAIRAREGAAHAALSALCHGGKFTMTIPVQPDDTDILIGNSLRDILHLLKQRAAAEQRIREEHDASVRADEQRAIASYGEQYEKARAEAAEQERDAVTRTANEWKVVADFHEQRGQRLADSVFSANETIMALTAQKDAAEARAQKWQDVASGLHVALQAMHVESMGLDNGYQVVVGRKAFEGSRFYMRKYAALRGGEKAS